MTPEEIRAGELAERLEINRRKSVERINTGLGKLSQKIIHRYSVERIPLSYGGYSRQGKYFGIGKPVFRVTDNETNDWIFVRADNARSARKVALTESHFWGGWK
jgi:hypothetical protein